MMLNINSIFSKIIEMVQSFWFSLLEERQLVENNIQELNVELNKLSEEIYLTKIHLINKALYNNIFFSNERFNDNIEIILKKYYKVIPYVFELGGRKELVSKNFNAKEVAQIILRLLYLKKDELDKIDNHLPII